MKKRQIKPWFSAALLSACGTHATAQDFPSRPVTLVAPYPAGSATDNVARHLAVALQSILGKPVIVDNRAGQLTQMLKTDTPKWHALIKVAGIEPQ